MSSCVICLVIAREIFLLQSDCSAITKVHNFSLLGLTCFVKDKQSLKTEDTLYNTIWIFSVTDQFVVFFHLNVSLYSRLFNESLRLIIGETSSPLLLLV